MLDLTQTAKTFDDVCGWVTRAIARELTDETRLNAAMSARLEAALAGGSEELIVAAAGGDHSVLEFRYHRDVERAHGLPESVRQVSFMTPGGRRGRRDRVYDEYGVVVELDGRLAHPAENHWKDKTRDNAAAADGKQSLRYGWSQVKWQPCETAAEVARVLRLHGWDGSPRTMLARLPGPAGPSPDSTGPESAGPEPATASPGQDRPSPARIRLTLRRNWRWPKARHSEPGRSGQVRHHRLTFGRAGLLQDRAEEVQHLVLGDFFARTAGPGAPIPPR